MERVRLPSEVAGDAKFAGVCGYGNGNRQRHVETFAEVADINIEPVLWVGAYAYIDKCIKLLRQAGFKKIRFRGDTDFTQTEHLDRWDDEEVLFVFGIDAMPNLIIIAESLENKDRQRLVLWHH